LRHLHAIACAALCLVVWGYMDAPAVAQTTSTADAASPHNADHFTNRDLMAQPERDRRIWLNALMVGATSVTGMHDVEAARCVARWYFEDDGELYRQILGSMEAYPDNRPAEVIFALARRACPAFVPSN
jgi:hypothetical protein